LMHTNGSGDSRSAGAMRDKAVFITGAAGGIGLAIGEACAAQGASVVISDLDGQRAESAAARLRAQGYDSIGIRCDVSVRKG